MPGTPRNTKDYFSGTYHKVGLLSTGMDTVQISIVCAKIAHHPSPSPILLSSTRKNSPVTITTSLLQRLLQQSRFLNARCNDKIFATAASGDSAPAPALDWKVWRLN
jgi:hypothetical protein